MNKNIATVYCALIVSMAWAQEKQTIGLKPIKDKISFYNMVERDSLQAMIELKSLIPTVQYELRYASKNNFTGQRLYPKNTHTTYLRRKPAMALAKVAEEIGFAGVLSGPLVRSSYRAGKLYKQAIAARNSTDV